MLFHEKHLLVDRALHSEARDRNQSPNLSWWSIRCIASLSQRRTIQFGCCQFEEGSMLDCDPTVSIVGIARGGQLQCIAKCRRRFLGQSGNWRSHHIENQSRRRKWSKFLFCFSFQWFAGHFVGIGHGHRQQFGSTSETLRSQSGGHRCQERQTREANRSVHIGCVIVTIAVSLGWLRCDRTCLCVSNFHFAPPNETIATSYIRTYRTKHMPSQSIEWKLKRREGKEMEGRIRIDFACPTTVAFVPGLFRCVYIWFLSFVYYFVQSNRQPGGCWWGFRTCPDGIYFYFVVALRIGHPSLWEKTPKSQLKSHIDRP